MTTGPRRESSRNSFFDASSGATTRSGTGSTCQPEARPPQRRVRGARIRQERGSSIVKLSGPFPHRVTSGGGRRVSAAVRKGNRRSAGQGVALARFDRRTNGRNGPGGIGRRLLTGGGSEEGGMPQRRHLRLPLSTWLLPE